MKIRIFVFLLLSIFSKNLIAQTIEVNELTVSHVLLKIENLIQERQTDGPVVNFKLTIRNNADSTIVIKPSNARFFLLFNYLEKEYSREFWPVSTLLFTEREPIALQKFDSLEVELTDCILLGTPLLKDITLAKEYDYSKEMLQILPTFRIVYYDGLNKITSIGIGSVKLKDYVYTPR